MNLTENPHLHKTDVIKRAPKLLYYIGMVGLGYMCMDIALMIYRMFL